jgi:hypothetical protein
MGDRFVLMFGQVFSKVTKASDRDTFIFASFELPARGSVRLGYLFDAGVCTKDAELIKS